MTDEKRPYRKRRRAELEAETRRRITESAVALHGRLGPARTSIVAIADHAGVRRSTVYRHFPDEAALFAACSSHWAAANPLPDLERWSAIEDADQRLRSALEELYGHYHQTAPMRDNVLRDEATLPLITQMLRPYRDYLEAARETLMKGRDARAGNAVLLRAAIGHALAFAAWSSLAREQHLSDAEAAELMARLVEAVSLNAAS